jgi:hypothetical protein
VLLQSDGDLVDVDGVSPVYFKNVDGGNYTVSVRHRNHLGMSSNPANPIALGLSNSPYDFTTAAGAGVFGVPVTNYTQVNGKNLLYAGNASLNTNVRYAGIGNDKDFMLSLLGGDPLGVLSTVYHQGDLNLNRIFRYAGISNDKDFLLATPAGSDPLAVRTQALPN